MNFDGLSVRMESGKTLRQVVERDTYNYVGGKKVLADMVGQAIIAPLEISPSEDRGEPHDAFRISPVRLVSAAVKASYNQLPQNQRANGFKVVDITETIVNDGDPLTDDYILHAMNYSVTLQFCRYVFERRNKKKK